MQLLNFNTLKYADDANISTEDIQAWYEGHHDDLRLPQYVDVDYILLDEAAAVASVPAVDEAQLQQYYEQNRTRFVSPARVQLSHILFATKAGDSDEERDAIRVKARETQRQVKADPQEFAAIAQAESDDKGSSRDGGSLGWVTKGSWPAVLEDGIFALAKGDVSDVIEGPDGFHIFKADDYVAESGPSFAEIKDEVEAEVRQQLAADRFAEMATQLTNLVYENSDSLNAAADALGLTIRHAKGVSREGVLAADDVGEGAAATSEDAQDLSEASVRRALFSSQSIAQRQNAGVIELASDKLIALRASEVHESQLPELDKVKGRIVAVLTQEAAARKAVEEGEATLAELQKNPESEADFTEIQSVNRLDNAGLDKNAVDAIMALSLETLPAYVGIKNETGYTIAKVVGEEHGQVDPALMGFISQQLQQLWADAEEQATLKALRDSLSVNELPALQRVIETGDDTEI